MQNNNVNIITRRAFLDRSFKTSMAVALSTLVDIPFVVKRALAEGTIGLNGKKLLFIWLRGANDALNSVIPVGDSSYGTGIRPTIAIPPDAGENYSSLGPATYPVNSASTDPTYNYDFAIKLGNGFAALHPRLKFLAPVYNAGDLALIHRVGYPRQSRSHFDSQNYWENGSPNNNLSKDGIFYRAMIESGLANTAPLTAVSIQSSLPLILRGSEAAMTNLTDPNRYDLLGIPNSVAGNTKATNAINAANLYPFSPKKNRDLLELQYRNLQGTLSIFAGITFTEAGNTYRDNEITDNDSVWANATPSADANRGYYLFPTNNDKNGGWRRTPGGATDAAKYVLDPSGSSYSFFNNLKAAALVLNKTDAIVAGTEYGGFDTHSTQGGVNGAHANLQRRLGWAIYALRKYFTLYADRATWDNIVVVTLTEFGRTTVENSDLGTDHAEAGVMFVAGGAVNGYGSAHGSGVYGCSTSEYGTSNPKNWAPGASGSMFGVSGRYLKRVVDYRSVLGEIIRDHLGATQNQINRIIPGYAIPGERLLGGGISSVDGTDIAGEIGVVG